MPYENCIGMLRTARANGYAVGAFNILDPLTINAVVKAAETKRSPIILQTSVKTVMLHGFIFLSATAKAAGERATVPVALHLDHCKDLAMIKECIENGWSSVMIDASAMPHEENVRLTRQAADMAHARGLSIEGELGATVGVEDDILVKEQDSHPADPHQAIDVVKRTGVDVFAPAIGTAHGFYKGEPAIPFDRLGKIASSVPAIIAIHTARQRSWFTWSFRCFHIQEGSYESPLEHSRDSSR